MNFNTDFSAFAEQFGAAWELYGRNLSPAAIDRAFRLLARYDLSDVLAAMACYDTQAKKEPPKPGDLVALLNEIDPAGHPSPAEAWNIVEQFCRDEGETAFMTEQMRAAWAVVSPSIEARDWIGARRDFQDYYRGLIEREMAVGKAAVWTVSFGHDLARREAAILAAQERGRIAPSYAAGLLPGPAVGLSEAIGLLAHDGAAVNPVALANLTAIRDSLRAASDLAERHYDEQRAESARRANEYCRQQEEKAKADQSRRAQA